MREWTQVSRARGVFTQRSHEFVRLVRDGRLSVSTRLAQRMGPPDRVLIFWDASARIVGIRPCTDQNRDSFKLSVHASKHGYCTYNISFRGVLLGLGLAAPYPSTVLPHWFEDDVLAIDLSALFDASASRTGDAAS